MKSLEDRPQEDYLVEEGDVRLVGSTCINCAFKGFPTRYACPECFEKVEEVIIPGSGTLEAFTTIRVSSPSFNTPYLFGSVRLDETNDRVFSPLVGNMDQFYQGVELKTCVTNEISEDTELWAFKTTSRGP